MKDKYNAVKKACKINDMIFNELVKDFSFRTEYEIARYIAKRFRQEGVRHAYPSIVANNCMDIHPKPRKEKLEEGFCVLDFGAKVEGYCSDMTRTLFFGKANAYEKKLYAMILHCQMASTKKVKIGAVAGDIDAYSRTLLGAYKKYFVHALGHGVGYRIHQKPTLRRNSTDILKENDMITIEPGIYFKKGKKEIGIRIEDTMVVRKKVEILSNSPKRLIEVPLLK